MIFTKTQIRILQVFAGEITELFTIREIARRLKMQPSLAHRAIKPLIDKKILMRNKQNHLSLNYQRNHPELAYIENLRSKEILHGDLALFVEDVLERLKKDFFVFLFFGSVVNKKKPRDIDVLVIAPEVKKIEVIKKVLYNLADNYEQKFDIQVISPESVYEMLARREEVNVMNEVLNKHLIIYGAETFYRLVQKGRR